MPNQPLTPAMTAASWGPGHRRKRTIHSPIDEGHGSVCQHECHLPRGGDSVTVTVDLLHLIRRVRNSGSPSPHRMAHYLGKPASAGVLKVLRGAFGAGFAELAASSGVLVVQVEPVADGTLDRAVGTIGAVKAQRPGGVQRRLGHEPRVAAVV